MIKNIEAQFYYMGKSADELKKGLDTINKTGYKAILLFLPNNMSYYGIQNNVNTTSSNTNVGTVTTRTATSKINFEQSFSFQLCLPSENMKRIWSASVKVDCDPGKAGAAKKITREILSCFEVNKYIL